MGNKQNTIEEIQNMIEILVGFTDNQKQLIKDIAERSFNLGHKTGKNLNISHNIGKEKSNG